MFKGLVVAAGMPRAGSGWHYNLIQDLVITGGGQDARVIRQRYLLHPILTEVNCNIGVFTTKRMLPVMVPVILGNTYTIKAHAGPSPIATRLIEMGKILPLYIYRDPRDALLSAYEYGQRKRESSGKGVFTELGSIEDAIKFMVEYVGISEAWLSCKAALHTRYEDLVFDYPGETKRIVEFLGINLKNSNVKAVIQNYSPDRGSSDQMGTHFVKGKVGRYRKVLTPEQQQACLESFGGFLSRMGYPIP